MQSSTLLRAAGRWRRCSTSNIDAVTAWRFGGLRIDNIPRSLWYTPQHTIVGRARAGRRSIAATAGADAPRGAIAGAGLALGLSTTMNPLLGGVVLDHLRV